MHMRLYIRTTPKEHKFLDIQDDEVLFVLVDMDRYDSRMYVNLDLGRGRR